MKVFSNHPRTTVDRRSVCQSWPRWLIPNTPSAIDQDGSVSVPRLSAPRVTSLFGLFPLSVSTKSSLPCKGSPKQEPTTTIKQFTRVASAGQQQGQEPTNRMRQMGFLPQWWSTPGRWRALIQNFDMCRSLMFAVRFHAAVQKLPLVLQAQSTSGPSSRAAPVQSKKQQL